VNKHLYLCHPLVLSSPTLMMHGHMNLKRLLFQYAFMWAFSDQQEHNPSSRNLVLDVVVYPFFLVSVHKAV